jgi:hypothetical protein
MKLIGKILGVAILLGILLFVGTCAWQNCRSPGVPQIKNPEVPTIETAGYSVNVTVTGQVFYSDKVIVNTIPTGDVVTMQGYWEVTKGEYIFHDIILSLNEQIFGKIEVKKR